MSQSEQAPKSNMPSAELVYFNALDGLDVADVADQITTAETAAAVSTKGARKNLKTIAELLNISRPKPAVLSGIVYGIKDNDDLDKDDPRLLMDGEVTFEGPEYSELDDALRIIFYLKQTLKNKETQERTSTRYGMFLESILRLEYLERSPLAVCALHSDEARELAVNPDFLNAEYTDQVSALQTTAIACLNELMGLLDDDDIEIACESYVVRMDAQNGEAPVWALYQQPDSFRGGLHGCIYPDVLRRNNQPFRAVSDFTYGPVPHIVMRDREAGKTTYIAIDAITSIE